MTAQEVHRLLAVIRVAYPNWQKGQEIAASNLWEEALAMVLIMMQPMRHLNGIYRQTNLRRRLRKSGNRARKHGAKIR